MGGPKKPALPGDVEQLRWRIEQWRRSRKRYSHVPKELWSEAVGLAQVHGVQLISQTLRLNHESLRNRVHAAGVPAEKGTAAGFVELRPAWFDTGPRCVVELREPDGTTMTITVTDPREIDVARLLDGFWSRRR